MLDNYHLIVGLGFPFTSTLNCNVSPSRPSTFSIPLVKVGEAAKEEEFYMYISPNSCFILNTENPNN